jgi:hypothetical protein
VPFWDWLRPDGARELRAAAPFWLEEVGSGPRRAGTPIQSQIVGADAQSAERKGNGGGPNHEHAAARIGT